MKTIKRLLVNKGLSVEPFSKEPKDQVMLSLLMPWTVECNQIDKLPTSTFPQRAKETAIKL